MTSIFIPKKQTLLFSYLLLIFFSFSIKKANAQRYTENFTSTPAFTAYPGVPSWIQTAEVTLGSVPYQIVNAGNGGWARITTGGSGNSANLEYNTAATTSVIIKRKDGLRFKFYGVWLKYTNYISEYYLPPYLSVSYEGATVNGVAAANETFNANTQVTLSKDISVTSVTLSFSGLGNLNFDDLIVGPDIVSTSVINTYNSTSATLGGLVSADASGVTERGIVYNTTGSPTTSDAKIQMGSGNGDFSQNITGLSSSTSYFARAYAINSFGTAYGDIRTFTTDVPFVLAGTHNFNTSWVAMTLQASPFTKYVEGWDITGVSSSASGLISVNRLTLTNAAEGAASIRALSSTSTENLSVMKVKADNGTAFDLQSFKFRYGTRAPTTTSFGRIIVTGYKNGNPVNGAQATMTNIAPYSSSVPGYNVFDLTGNPKFRNIDQFTIEAADPVNSARLYYFDLDVLTVKDIQAISSNADLSGLGLSVGTLSPSFTSATTAYSASVGNDVTSVSVTPVVADANASIKVNGTTVASGSSTTVSGLSVGSNTVTIVVTAQDGTTIKTCSLSISRAASANADLSGLSISEGSLSPAFTSANTAYSATVANIASSVTVTPSAQSANATIKVNGTTVASGSSTTVSGLSVGSNTVTIVVTAQDGTTIKTYSLSISRAASANADLSGLLISEGSLSPAFTSANTAYSATVANSVSSVTVTPSAQSENATITVNNIPVTGGSASDAIELNEGLNTITIEVTAQDETTKHSYTIEVTRSVPAITISNINSSGYCANDTLSAVFASPVVFNEGNIFKLELSDASGNFSLPLVLASVAGTDPGSIGSQLPAHITGSSFYKIRVSSTDPAITGIASNSVAIHDRPAAPSIDGRGNTNAGLTYSYTASANAGSTWQWSAPATINQQNNIAKITWLSPGTKQPLTVVETSQYGCVGDTGKTSITVYNLAIENVTVSTLTPCPAGDMMVTAKVSGVFNQDANDFIAELSSKDGSFTKATVIGRIHTNSVGNNKSISIPSIIPFPVANSNNYRVRVISSSPGFAGNDNGLDIQINKPMAGADKVVNKCTGAPTDLTALYKTEGLTSDWSTADPTNVTDAGFYTLIVTNAIGCKDTAVVEVREYPKPDLGKDTVIKITDGLPVDLTVLYNTDTNIARWNTQTPKAVSATGRYRLIALNNGCRDTAYIRIINNTPVLAGKAGNLLSAENKMMLTNDRLDAAVFPNPAKAGSKLQVSGAAKSYSITLSDLSGKEVWKSSNVSISLVTLPVEKLAPGVYNITVNSGSAVKTLRFVKD